MDRQITVKRTWFEIDTLYGTWFVDTEDAPEMFQGAALINHPLNHARALKFTECADTSGILNISIREGYGARLSMPGYLDATDWAVFDTEAEAEEYIKDELEGC